MERIENRRVQGLKNGDATLALVRGSSGIGKSVFLGYLLANYAAHFTNIAIIYASKSAKLGAGIETSSNKCVTWIDGTKTEGRLDSKMRDHLQENMEKLDLIALDGCSLNEDLHGFLGLMLVAASPSTYVDNLVQTLQWHFSYTMPPLDKAEALAIADIVGVGEDVVRENLKYMDGITRHLYGPGAAKARATEALARVNATNIAKMVSLQATNKEEEIVAVHSLVSWNVRDGDYEAPPRFEMVSRYAEQQVARKLANEKLQNLQSLRRALTQVSGAEGHAGALFEAYAIRTLQNGCKLTLRYLEGKKTKTETIVIPQLGQPIVVESNKLTIDYAEVRVPDPARRGSFLPRLLWPTTTNFPTFDCFYFHFDGRVFCLQMTIARQHDLKNSGAKNAKDYFDAMPPKRN